MSLDIIAGATLILLPLLGLHYVVMPFRPEAGAPGEIAYQIVSAIFTSFQLPSKHVKRSAHI
ncbi:hypothetical protein OUZ56_009385 [Daphnia magna]|uniref:Uncharacterized protein n=1 Tax=Daphnia magna TaxID=35525 RepID=A0ABR0AFZ6_9CRUS|nr:hypothetical protein OUZ56_009385 [Daphnia magna]